MKLEGRVGCGNILSDEGRSEWVRSIRTSREGVIKIMILNRANKVCLLIVYSVGLWLLLLLRAEPPATERRKTNRGAVGRARRSFSR